MTHLIYDLADCGKNRRSKCYVKYFFNGRCQAWTGDRKQAGRFSKDEAKEVAAQIERHIEADGYGKVRLHVMPARGGMDVWR